MGSGRIGGSRAVSSHKPKCLRIFSWQLYYGSGDIGCFRPFVLLDEMSRISDHRVFLILCPGNSGQSIDCSTWYQVYSAAEWKPDQGTEPVAQWSLDNDNQPEFQRFHGSSRGIYRETHTEFYPDLITSITRSILELKRYFLINAIRELMEQ